MKKKFAVVIYETTRNYGGPEEGGWWYNWESVHRVRLCRTYNRALRLADQWVREWKRRYAGRIGSHWEPLPCNYKNGYHVFNVRVESCPKPLPYQPDTHYS